MLVLYNQYYLEKPIHLFIFNQQLTLLLSNRQIPLIPEPFPKSHFLRSHCLLPSPLSVTLSSPPLAQQSEGDIFMTMWSVKLKEGNSGRALMCVSVNISSSTWEMVVEWVGSVCLRDIDVENSYSPLSISPSTHPEHFTCQPVCFCVLSPVMLLSVVINILHTHRVCFDSFSQKDKSFHSCHSFESVMNRACRIPYRWSMNGKLQSHDSTSL